MNIFQHHIRHAITILQLYDGKIPFAAWLKDYFREQKKYGSRDRKQIAQICYSYFRMGNMRKINPTENDIIESLFLCAENSHPILEPLRPEWNALSGSDIAEKAKQLKIDLANFQIFPPAATLSTGMDAPAFNLSHLRQPLVFIRIRPGNKKMVLSKLEKAAVAFKLLGEDCIAVSAAVPLNNLLMIDKEIIIQDYSSQCVGGLISLVKPAGNKVLNVWDCCAASGGKSILAKDVLGNIKLTVSDIRESILQNLKKRFIIAGIGGYHAQVADLSKPLKTIQGAPFDLVIADVPCSGSGTWGRTPEQLCFFKEKTMQHYQQVQQKIISQVYPFIKQGGYLLYITCSVFAGENEDNVKYITMHTGLQLVKMELFKGYGLQADTLFAALFKQP
jgi:16S rRNA (cytosine967-C5)-methyltransferase